MVKSKRVKGLWKRIERFLLFPLLGVRPWMTVPWRYETAYKWLDWLYMIDIKLQEIFWGEEGETITQQIREADSWFLRNIVKHFAYNRDPQPEDDEQ